LPADAATSRFDAVMKSPARDEGLGVPYQVQYALHPSGTDKSLWIEDIGRWFAGGDGKPVRAHGVVRVINERHDQEARLTYLSRFDGLTGEMNRFHLTEVLESTLKQALAQRNSCGFMLVAIDNLARINESYGFDVADEAIGAVAKRLRAKMRGGDQLGRFSGNKFGLVLKNCTIDDMNIAAERFLAASQEELEGVPGIPERTARSIYAQLHKAGRA
jgi:diguanylate cyclase (GGDEF)-like protein